MHKLPASLGGVICGSLISVACGGATESVPSAEGEQSPGTFEPGTSEPPSIHLPPQNPTIPSPPPEEPIAWAGTKVAGCGDFTLYVPDLSESRFLVIDAKKDQLGIVKVGDEVTVDLATAPASVVVHVDNYPKKPLYAPYCNDVQTGEKPTSVWHGIVGKITFKVTGQGREGDYAVAATLTDVRLQKPDGTTYFISGFVLGPAAAGSSAD